MQLRIIQDVIELDIESERDCSFVRDRILFYDCSVNKE